MKWHEVEGEAGKSGTNFEHFSSSSLPQGIVVGCIDENEIINPKDLIVQAKQIDSNGLSGPHFIVRSIYRRRRNTDLELPSWAWYSPLKNAIIAVAAWVTIKYTVLFHWVRIEIIRSKVDYVLVCDEKEFLRRWMKRCTNWEINDSQEVSAFEPIWRRTCI